MKGARDMCAYTGVHERIGQVNSAHQDKMQIVEIVEELHQRATETLHKLHSAIKWGDGAINS